MSQNSQMLNIKRNSMHVNHKETIKPPGGGSHIDALTSEILKEKNYKKVPEFSSGVKESVHIK